MKMNKVLRTFVCFVLMLLFARSALAHRIVSCEPEWAALAKELGGEMVTVYSATTGLQNPHPYCPTIRTKSDVDFWHGLRAAVTVVYADGCVGLGLPTSADRH
jgi:ABC-type Zn uptake system ZnuABC Zn-binding protein ZnuA